MDHNLEKLIRERAYEIWTSHGCVHGQADQHWLAAEREILTATRSPRLWASRCCWSISGCGDEPASLATGGLAMRTTILAYVIAIIGLVLIVAGARDISKKRSMLL